MIICAGAVLASVSALGYHAPFQYDLRHKISPDTTIAQGAESAVSPPNATTNSVQTVTNNSLTLEDLFTKTQPSVVQVSSISNENSPLSGASIGSGFIY